MLQSLHELISYRIFMGKKKKTLKQTQKQTKITQNNPTTKRINKMNCELILTYDNLALRQTGCGIWRVKKTASHDMGYLYEACGQISDSCYQKLLRKMRRKMCIYKCMLNVYKNPQNRQTGSRNLMGPKTFPTIWGTDMKLVTKYQIPVINSCLEKCDEKWAYMFNVYKNQQSRQTRSRNRTGPKTLPTIWYTYMMLVTKYQISAINSYWEKCDEKYFGRTEGRTEVKRYTPLPLRGAGVYESGGIITTNIWYYIWI